MACLLPLLFRPSLLVLHKLPLRFGVSCPFDPDKLLLSPGLFFPAVPDKLPLTFSWGRFQHRSHVRSWTDARAAPLAAAFSSVCFLLVARRKRHSRARGCKLEQQ